MDILHFLFFRKEDSSVGTAERRIEIMRLLCCERHVTMQFLADKFSVSVRTIKRDIDELGYIIPLEIKTGRYEGGVYVMNGYFWDKVYMCDEDIALLRTIIVIGEAKARLVLDKSALQRLKKMIDTYSLPKAK